MKQYVDFAMECAVEAGEFVIKKSGRMDSVSFKSYRSDLVTEMDKKCEALIKKNIKKKYPSHSILAEESGKSDRKTDFRWIIDPIDGTTNFVQGFPMFAVSIALEYKNRSVVGVIYDPNTKELFHASEGKGAYLNGRRISVSEKSGLGNALLSSGYTYSYGKAWKKDMKLFIDMVEHCRSVRCLGTAAIEIAYVACGRLDGFWEASLCPWDFAAGVVLVREAGGKVSGFDGKELKNRMGDVIITNGRIHKEMMKVINN